MRDFLLYIRILVLISFYLIDNVFFFFLIKEIQKTKSISLYLNTTIDALLIIERNEVLTGLLFNIKYDNYVNIINDIDQLTLFYFVEPYTLFSKMHYKFRFNMLSIIQVLNESNYFWQIFNLNIPLRSMWRIPHTGFLIVLIIFTWNNHNLLF